MTNAALPTFRLPSGTCVAQAQTSQHAPVTLESPALAVMTDLSTIRAATVPPGTPIEQAELKMIHQGVRLLFVVNESPRVDGIVTSRDLQGEKPMRLIQQRRIRHNELLVHDVMTPLAELDAVEFGALSRATVGEVVSTLRKFGHPHLMVVEAPTAAAPARIRGLVSQSQVERQLGAPLNMVEVASTFAELQQALS